MVTTEERRRRLELVADAAALRAKRRWGVAEFYLWCLALFIQVQPFEILVSGRDPIKHLSSVEGSHRGEYFREGLALVAIIVFCWSKRDRIGYLKVIAPFFIYCAVCALSALINPNQFWGFKSLAVYVLSAATAMAMSFRLRPVEFARAALYVFLLCAILSILTVFADPSLGRMLGAGGEGFGAWRGVLVHKNNLAHDSAIGLVLTFFYGRTLLKKTFLPRLLHLGAWLGVLGIFLLCLVEAKSAGALVLAAALIMLYYAVMWPQGQWRYVSIVATSVVLAFVIAYKDIISAAALKAVSKSPDLTGRTEIWSFSFDEISKSPFLGHGYNYTQTPPFLNRLWALFQVSYTHNNYIDTLMNVGFIGLGALMFAALCALWMAWSKAPFNRANAKSDYDVARGCFTLVLVGWLIGATSETSNTIFGQFCFIALFGLWGCAYDAIRARSGRASYQPVAAGFPGQPPPRRRPSARPRGPAPSDVGA